ncbi:MAG: riboflavin synthase [Candidatus Omnitrophota bacterium]|jgi:riboflavin synthase
MFTGIISETGKVESITRKGSSFSLKVKCKSVNKGLEAGDSVAVNGVCLSAVGKDPQSATFDVVKNTFNITNLKRLKTGDPVNLEGSLKVGDKLSGHMVTGHIDGERVIKANKETSNGWMIEVAARPEDGKYLVPKGAVAVDGVSLTIGELFRGSFRIFLIPHTRKNTTFELKKAGDYVNVEFDILAKYAERKGPSSSVTKEMLMEKGFI